MPARVAASGGSTPPGRWRSITGTTLVPRDPDGHRHEGAARDHFAYDLSDARSTERRLPDRHAATPCRRDSRGLRAASTRSWAGSTPPAAPPRISPPSDRPVPRNGVDACCSFRSDPSAPVRGTGRKARGGRRIPTLCMTSARDITGRSTLPRAFLDFPLGPRRQTARTRLSAESSSRPSRPSGRYARLREDLPFRCRRTRGGRRSVRGRDDRTPATNTAVQDEEDHRRAEQGVPLFAPLPV